MTAEGLSKSERIHSDDRIDALFKQGRRGHSGVLNYCWRAAGGGSRAGGEGGCDAGAKACSKETDGMKAGVAILVSVPKKSFKRAWKRNLIKRRIKESYRRRKQALAEKALARGVSIDIAFVCSPDKNRGAEEASKISGRGAGKSNGKDAGKSAGKVTQPEIPDFKTIDDAVAKILEQILARS